MSHHRRLRFRLWATKIHPHPSAGQYLTRSASAPVSSSEPAVSGGELPAYRAIREAATRHGGNVKDVRWSEHHACRALGGVAAGR